MNTKPLKDYIRAREAHKEGNDKEALALLSSSLGAEKPTQMMKSALKELVEFNDAALTIVLANSNERK